MAVPKKRTSKAKKRSRKSKWLGKIQGQIEKAISLAKSLETGKKKNIVEN